MSIDNSLITWPVSFVCTVVNENIVLANSYNLNLSLMPIDSAPGSITAGFNKLRYFIDTYLHNSILIAKDNPLLDSFSKTKNNLVILPVEPYDLYVGHTLYCKFLAITEKNFHIDLINIDSAIGDNICYSILDTDGCGLDLEGDHWWNADNTWTGSGPVESWGDLVESNSPKFEPKIIKGGKKSDN